MYPRHMGTSGTGSNGCRTYLAFAVLLDRGVGSAFANFRTIFLNRSGSRYLKLVFSKRGGGKYNWFRSLLRASDHSESGAAHLPSKARGEAQGFTRP